MSVTGYSCWCTSSLNTYEFQFGNNFNKYRAIFKTNVKKEKNTYIASCVKQLLNSSPKDSLNWHGRKRKKVPTSTVYSSSFPWMSEKCCHMVTECCSVSNTSLCVSLLSRPLGLRGEIQTAIRAPAWPLRVHLLHTSALHCQTLDESHLDSVTQKINTHTRTQRFRTLARTCRIHF